MFFRQQKNHLHAFSVFSVLTDGKFSQGKNNSCQWRIKSYQRRKKSGIGAVEEKTGTSRFSAKIRRQKESIRASPPTRRRVARMLLHLSYKENSIRKPRPREASRCWP